LVVEEFQSAGEWSKYAGPPKTVGPPKENEITLEFLKACVSGASFEGRPE
jgi:hypothetical protein